VPAVVDGQNLLEVRSLDVAYGCVQVLFDVDVEVRAGETLALLGTNGAGKSTLLKALSGLLAPARGSIVFDGTDITSASTQSRVAAGIVQMRGGTAVFPSLTVAENLRLGAFTILQDRPRAEQRIAHVLDLFPALATRLDTRAGAMSGGEQQMVALAKALLLEPRLLIIDELSLGLAPVIVQRLLDTLAELKATGLSMLIVEQSLNVAISFADRAVFMERGEVQFAGDPVVLAERGDLVRAVFLGGGRHAS
jgi:ABC-type branched-subunit amino acid transport system ATPase component